MKQYYYRIGGCPADKHGDVECRCWHSIGTGPYPGATPDNAPMLGLSGLPLQLTWRDVPDEVKSDKPKEFKREIRYQVYKRKDIDKMPYKPRKAARALLAELDALLTAFDVPCRKCVVVEEDWPEYEKVWQMIEERVTKHTHEIKLSLPPRLSPDEVATHTHARSKPADEVHPNEEGRRRIAEAVAHELSLTLPPRVSPAEPSVTYTPPIKLDKGGSLEVTLPGDKELLISIDPARQGGDYGCRLECTVQPDGAVQVENVELQEAREELARVRAELELFTTSVRRRESELSAELDHVKQVNAELMQGLKRLLRLGNGGTLFTAKHLDSVVNGYFGSKAELALRHAIK